MYNVTRSVLACILTVSFGVPSFATADNKDLNASGYLVMRKGNTMTFIKTEKKTFVFNYGSEKKTTDMPISQLKKITFGEHSKSAEIVLKNGKTVSAEVANREDRNTGMRVFGVDTWVRGSTYFSFYYLDDLKGGQTKKSVNWSSIAQITFDDTVGRFRVCPHCKSTWPDDFLFCPHDGSRTVWGEPSGSLLINVKTTEEEKAQRRANVMESILNASLASSGIDPASEEASRAKEFGKLWMNPTADPKEIHKKLDELRQQFLKQNSEKSKKN